MPTVTRASNAAPTRLVIATRASRLALAQAHEVQARLQALYPACAVELLALSTRGDQILDRSLAKVGGKGLFVKELQTALLDGRADLAVHSLKDVPADLSVVGSLSVLGSLDSSAKPAAEARPAAGAPLNAHVSNAAPPEAAHAHFVLAAITARGDARDALVSPRYASLAELPAGAVVGTSSLRREAQLRALRPDLHVRPLRGNVETRLAKLDAGDYDAIVLAAAGLQRLGLAARIRACLPVEASLPAAGQGALGIETLRTRHDIAAWLAPLACAPSTACGLAERAISRVLGGSCQVPLAAYAQVQGEALSLRALVATPDGTRILREQAHGPLARANALGEQVARKLLAAGADRLLAELLQQAAAHRH